jgi:hypothetical protein
MRLSPEPLSLVVFMEQDRSLPHETDDTLIIFEYLMPNLLKVPFYLWLDINRLSMWVRNGMHPEGTEIAFFYKSLKKPK